MTEAPATPSCGRPVFWWDGEYEGECELPEGHEGDHFDGMYWFDDDNESKDWAHSDDAVRRCSECGAQCDLRIQVCECEPDCPLPPVAR